MTAPVILNPIDSGSNTIQTSWVISYPAYNNGDLVVIATANDDNTNVLSVTAPAGPNAETLTKVVDQHTGGQADQRISVFWYIATSTEVAGTLTFTASAAEQWVATVFRVATGDFDAATPIGAATIGGNSTADTFSRMFSFTAGASDGGSTLLCWGGIDNVPLRGTPLTGWTYLANQDIGAVSGFLAKRTAATTNSESIGVADFDLTGASADTSATYGFIVRAAAAAGGGGAAIHHHLQTMGYR